MASASGIDGSRREAKPSGLLSAGRYRRRPTRYGSFEEAFCLAVGAWCVEPGATMLQAGPNAEAVGVRKSKL